MGIRRIIPLLLIVITAFGCSLYLESKYNLNVIEYRYNGELDWLTIKKLDDDFGGKNNNINLESGYRGYKLIATTGKDMYMKNIKMERGSFLIESYGNYAVIGDQVADEYFSTTDIIDKSMIIKGCSYEIKGIIKDSRNIYIPFNEEMNDIDWNKKTIRFVPNNDKDSDVLINDFINLLINRDIQITDTIIYERKIKAYTNLSILILIYLGYFLIMTLIQKSRLGTAKLGRGYISKRRRIEWYNYIKEKRKEVTNNLRYLLGIIFMLVLAYKLIKGLYIPSSMVPTNPFALSSYIAIIKEYYSSFMLHLENGFSSIDIDMVKLNIMMLIIYLLSSKLFRENYKSENKKENTYNAVE